MPLDLPTELWLRIAHYVPDDGLSSLFRVSHRFHEFTKDRAYRHLVFDDDRPFALTSRLQQIENDSTIPGIVTSLSVYPRAIRSACLRSAGGKKTLRKANHRDWPTSFRLETSKIPVPEDLTLADRLLTGLSGLHAVRKLRIEWRMASTPEMLFCFPLLTALWPSLGQQLTNLTLDMGLDYLCQLVEDLSALESIQTLSLNIGPYALNPVRLHEAEQGQRNLAKFVNRISPTLQSLAIATSEHLRLCTFFNNLSFFPQLCSLALHLPFDSHHFDDPKGINIFLQSHPTINDLSFGPIHCCKHSNSLWKSIVKSWPDPDEWLCQAFNNVKFEDLRTLEIGLNVGAVSPSRRVLPATKALGNVVNKLEVLTIAGVFTSIEDLDSALGPFSQNGKVHPKKVVLEVHVLHQLVLESIAKTFPSLEMLDLTYRWINTAGNCDEGPFVLDMQGRTYKDWNLKLLFLRCSDTYDSGRRPSRTAISQSIPNLIAKP